MAESELPGSAAPLAASASPASGGEAEAHGGASHRAGRLAPWLLALFAALMAALAPLYEMDLAQHLASGEWIVRHHAVPFTEPFAWTRPGQPYFAYSWLPQVLFYGLLHALGPLGLHLLEGAIAAGAVAATLWAGRQLGWSRPVALVVAGLDLLVCWGLANTLRPQQILLVLLPLAWGVAGRIRAHGPRAGNLLALAAVGALAANTHLFFPLTAAPLAYYLLVDGDGRRWGGAGLALLLGWLASPYGLSWPAVFALNFGHNALLKRPPSVGEFRPGFEYWSGNVGVITVVVALLAGAWLVAAAPRARRERVVLALFWGTGLLLFAYAGRLVLAWWALAFPLAGAAAQRALEGAAALPVPPRSARLLAGGGALVLLLAAAPDVRPRLWAYEGDTVHRMLPRAAADPTLWLPSWLLCHTRPGAGGRVFTEFNYGSELNWRLPGYSPSIDGRTIFPDSDAVEFAFAVYGGRHPHASTWRHAQLALVKQSLWATPLLARDPAWLLLATAGSERDAALLFARRDWWARWGATAALPATGIMPGDPRTACPAAGTFPRP